MAQYPPPPDADQHFAGIYPTSQTAQHLLDQQSHDLQYANLGTSAYSKVEYPKVEDTGMIHSNATSISHLTPELQQQHHQSVLEEQQRQQIHQVAHHIQQHPSHPHSPTSLPSGALTAHSAGTDAQKANRLRKACDSCSIRKVKCDEAGPPCKACAALDLPCTFDRPSRRRGPPNRHAEAVKRRRLEEAQIPGTSGSPHLSGASSPSSPTHAAQALAALSTQSLGSMLSAESICPADMIDLLIDDFFTYIHPLCPFPHEPSFREAWHNREDLSNKSFLALLASMIGVLVSSFPRKPRLHLKAQKRENLFPNHMSLVNRCQQVCSLARGPGYLENDNLNVYDAATSYFLALMSIYTFRWRLGRLYFGECLTIIRTLGLHKSREQTRAHLNNFSATAGTNGDRFEGERGQPLDNITLEMGRRIFWTMFVSIRTLEQLGASFGELIMPPPTPSEPYPPLPVEVDDFCIFPTHNDVQPAGLPPIMAGFNANVRVFASYNSLATMELAWGIEAIVDWERQEKVLDECIRRCHSAIDGLASELKVHPNRGPFMPHSHANGYDSEMHDADQASAGQGRRGDSVKSPQERRRTQQEIQKANIYASSLSTRSYIVEKYFVLRAAHERSNGLTSPAPISPATAVMAAGIDRLLPQQARPMGHNDAIGDEMGREREVIIKDLLTVLSSIDRVNMEPNASSFTMKIRSIASTLLDVPTERKGHLAQQTEEYLAAFLKTLMQLERVGAANSDSDQISEEEAELQHWADLRDFQLKFAQQGGLAGMS